MHEAGRVKVCGFTSSENFLMWISSNEARAQITEFISIINDKWYPDVK